MNKKLTISRPAHFIFDMAKDINRIVSITKNKVRRLFVGGHVVILIVDSLKKTKFLKIFKSTNIERTMDQKFFG